jgi:hypothetical protein
MFYKSNQPKQPGWFRKVLSEMAAGWASLPGFGKWLLVFSLGLLLISLTQPAFYIDWQDPRAYSNSRVLFFCGWMGFFAGSVDSFLWLANPLFFASVVLLLRRRKGFSLPGWWRFCFSIGLCIYAKYYDRQVGRTHTGDFTTGWLFSMAGRHGGLVDLHYVC